MILYFQSDCNSYLCWRADHLVLHCILLVFYT